MNGRYRIPLACGETPEQNKRVQRLLKSLDAGAVVTVTVHNEPLVVAWGGRCEIRTDKHGRYEAGSYAEIVATGGKCRKRIASRVTVVPAKVTPEKCRKSQGRALPLCLRDDLIPRRHCGEWRYRIQKHERNQKTGHAIARAIAQGRARITLDELGGGGPASFPVAQIIEENKRNAYKIEPSTLQPITVGLAARVEAYRDLLYWRELEALSGQREHFKPGRTDENAYADDEVAA